MRLHAMLWPHARLSEALHAVTRAHGLSTAPWPDLPLHLDEASEVHDREVIALGTSAGVLIEPIQARDGDIALMIARSGPSVLHVAAHGHVHLLAVVKGARGGKIVVLAPDGQTYRVPIRFIVDLLRSEFDRIRRPAVDALLRRIGLPQRKHASALQVLLADRPAVAKGWMVRPRLEAAPAEVLSQSGALFLGVSFIVAHALSTTLVAAAWWGLGSVALSGTVDPAWLAVWALALVGRVPLSLFSSWARARLSVQIGVWLRQRLMLGVLRSRPSPGEGSGRLLARVLESEALQSQALAGAFSTVTAGFEVVVALALLLTSSGGALSGVGLLGWLGVLMLLLRRRHQAHEAWTRQRLSLTHDLVERVVGHRTRKIQASGATPPPEEDAALASYATASKALDDLGTLLETFAARGWVVVGIGSIVPALIAGGQSAASIAVALGGILLAARAITGGTAGAVLLSNAWVAAAEIRELYRNATRAPRPSALPGISHAARLSDSGSLRVEGVGYTHPGRGDTALSRCSLTIGRGNHTLLLGASGSGKSTLAAIIAGQVEPDHGTVSLAGFDRASWGDAQWSHRIAFVPQFHDNHILSGTLAFNLLMGRQWPASEADLRAAEFVCRGLGLGPLLERMPAGMQQPVGFAGWHLSHGERSRVFIARAILQQPDIAIFDESFGTLDPDALSTAMRFTLENLPTSVVIAHP